MGRAFSFETTEYILDQLPCWLTYTNDRTHKVIDDNLHLSQCIQVRSKEQVLVIVHQLKINLCVSMINLDINFPRA